MPDTQPQPVRVTTLNIWQAPEDGEPAVAEVRKVRWMLASTPDAEPDSSPQR